MSENFIHLLPEQEVNILLPPLICLSKKAFSHCRCPHCLQLRSSYSIKMPMATVESVVEEQQKEFEKPVDREKVYYSQIYDKFDIQ